MKKSISVKITETSFVKYFLLVFVMIFFVILYVWQNIEVMKLKIEYRKRLLYKESLIKDNDMLLYKIEKYKTMKYIEQYSSKNNFVPMYYKNFGTINIKE